MDLVIQHNIHVNLGDVIYYVNDATKASHGDCGVHKLNKHDIERPNSYLIDAEELKKNPDLKGSYNVPRAIATLNKKLKLFLVVFKPEIRDKIMIKEPKDKELFMLHECELVCGCPIKPEDQDDVQRDLLIPEEKEYKFWNKFYVNTGGEFKTTLEDIIDPSLPDFEDVLSYQMS
jgi:hypothetical protein